MNGSSVKAEEDGAAEGIPPKTKSFVCSTCDQSFLRIYELKRHIATHSDAKFECSDCGTMFNRKDALLRHQRASNGNCRSKGRASRQIKHAAAAGLMGLAASTPALAEPRFLILPLPANWEALLDYYFQHGWHQHPVFHIETFRSRVKKLAATKQERSDYLALDLCPVLVQAVFWTAVKLTESNSQELWGAACWANMVAWAARLGLEDFATDALEETGTPNAAMSPGSGSHVGQEPVPTASDYYRFVRTGVVLVHVLLTLGRAVATVRLREWYTRAHRLAGFGTDPADLGRDPTDLAAWIHAEERSRASIFVILYDGLLTELQGVKPTTFSSGYLLRAGEIRCSDRGSDAEAEAVETFEQGTYGNIAMPCSDSLWELLPVAADIGDGWVNHPLSVATQQWRPVLLRETWTWMDLPYGSEERRFAVDRLFGDCLSKGFIFWLGCVMPTLTSLVRYRDHCLVRGFKLNDPPSDFEPDAVKARAMRDSLVLQFRDIWEALPPEILECDESADAKRLYELGASAWSPRLGIHAFNTLLGMHGWLLTLNSPRDVFQDLREAASGVALRADGNNILDRLLEWSTSADFIIASSHAIAISKLARSILDLEGKPDSTGKPLSVVRSFTSLLPFFVIRAAWIHVICILNLKRSTGDAVLMQIPGTPGESLTAGFLETLLDDVGACLRSIEAMAAPSSSARAGQAKKRPRLGSDPWRYASTAHSVVRKLLSVDMGMGQGGLELSEDEVEMLQMLKDVGN